MFPSAFNFRFRFRSRYHWTQYVCHALISRTCWIWSCCSWMVFSSSSVLWQPSAIRKLQTQQHVKPWLGYNCDSTTIRLRQEYDEKLICSFLLASNRVEWKQARAIRRSRIAIVSYSLYHNYDSTTTRLWSDYDISRTPASIRRKQKMNMPISRRSRVVVVS